MNKQEILNTYGEYGVPLEIAKTLKEYDFCWVWNFEDFKNYVNKCNEQKEWLEFPNVGGYSDDMVVKLQFGHIDLEVTVRGWNEEENKLDIDYYCCSQGSPTKHNENGWNSFEGADLIFYINQLETEEKFEEIIYTELMKIAKHSGLYWSKLNN